MSSVVSSSQILLFVYGHAGKGETYLWKILIAALRSTSRVVLAVAASGIASLLLLGGRTTHSRFKIPLELTNDFVCNIKKNTNLCELLLETSLIVGDQAPMSDRRRCFESWDKTLQDLTCNTSQLFGGKSVLLGGDFRHTLPVKPKCTFASSPRTRVLQRRQLMSQEIRNNARVLRSWVPDYRDNELHFLLVDQEVLGIQAVTKDNNCTNVYVDDFTAVITHPAMIRLGSASVFTPIANTQELPTQYFDFATRRKMELEAKKEKGIIDFIGVYLKLEDRTSKKGRPYGVLTLRDIRHERCYVEGDSNLNQSIQLPKHRDGRLASNCSGYQFES